MSGFAHFDAGSHETFSAALILLCLEEDATFQTRLTRLIRGQAGLAADGALVGWGREEALAIGTDSGRRSDLWLEFTDGLLLVEVKTHSGWPAHHVVQQVSHQRRAQLRGQPVREAILLAPGQLLRQLPSHAFPTMSWRRLLGVVEAIDKQSRVLQLAYEHWSEHVEQDFGLNADASVLPLAAVSIQTGCLVAFLRATMLRLDGNVSGGAVWFSSPNGSYRSNRDWTWFGLAVPGRLSGGERAYVGIYTYTKGPPGEPLGTFLEAYKVGDEDNALASIRFEPPDLTTETLAQLLTAFVDAMKLSAS